MELLILIILIIFVGLVFTHPIKKWDLSLNDKYSRYLKEFRQEQKKNNRR